MKYAPGDKVSMEEESGASKPEGTKSKEIKKAGNTKGGFKDQGHFGLK
jgi:hypothetical protein